jgi:hypothetical protein
MLASSTALSAGLADSCPKADFQRLSASVVSIRGETIENGTPHLQQATGWLIAPARLVTIEHVSDAMFSTEWKETKFSWGDTVRGSPTTQGIVRNARIVESVATGLPERITIIELDSPLEGRIPAKVRAAPLRPDEPVVGIGYRWTDDSETLQYARGRHARWADGGEPAEGDEQQTPFLLFELANEKGDDRYVFDHGASGSPIFDCEGKVVAVANSIFAYTLDQFAGILKALDPTASDEVIRVTTAWGEPNTSGVPAAVLAGH